ncbi:hypothetical protein BDK51DRAFT_39301, partial [Blyttiomyces helicus]
FLDPSTTKISSISRGAVAQDEPVFGADKESEVEEEDCENYTAEDDDEDEIFDYEIKGDYPFKTKERLLPALQSAGSSGSFQTENICPTFSHFWASFDHQCFATRWICQLLELAGKAGLAQKLLLPGIRESELGFRSVLRSGGPGPPCSGIGGFVSIKFPRVARLQCPFCPAAQTYTWARQHPMEKKEKIGNGIRMTIFACVCVAGGREGRRICCALSPITVQDITCIVGKLL